MCVCIYILTYYVKSWNPTCFLIKMEKYMFSFLLLLWEAAENGKNNKNYSQHPDSVYYKPETVILVLQILIDVNIC